LELNDDIKEKPLSEQLYTLSNKYVKLKPENKDVIRKINQLLKQIRDFEEIFNTNTQTNTEVQTVSNKDLIIQLENTIISENPLDSEIKEEDAVIVSTAQKLIDNSIKSKHTFF